MRTGKLGGEAAATTKPSSEGFLFAEITLIIDVNMRRAQNIRIANLAHAVMGLEMRVSICSTEVADRFGKGHRNLVRSIRKLMVDDWNSRAFFVESEYISKQNKKLKCYEMNFSGFSLLTDTWWFSRGESAPVKASIIAEFGETCVVLSSSRTRREDCFYEMLTEIFPHTKVIRQYHIAGYRVDFYMPEHLLFIEFDEEQHFSERNRQNDIERWEAISSFVSGEFDDKIELIRVDVGNELRGIVTGKQKVLWQIGRAHV